MKAFFFEDEDPDIEVFRNQAQKFKFDEKEYLAAVSRVPRWSRETINAVMSFYSEFATMVSMLNYRTLRLVRALEERKQLQAQLLHARKMESVGVLAGGIAHEGYITCQSRPGKGTTFNIYWPAVNT